MQEKIVALSEERKNVHMLILRAAVTIQRFARGFITRLKVRRVYRLQMEFERARLDDALAQMQAIIAAQARNMADSPMKLDEDKEQTSGSQRDRKIQHAEFLKPSDVR